MPLGPNAMHLLFSFHTTHRDLCEDKVPGLWFCFSCVVQRTGYIVNSLDVRYLGRSLILPGANDKPAHR